MSWKSSSDQQLIILEEVAKSITNINNTLTIILNEFIAGRSIKIDREVPTIDRCCQTTDSSTTADRISQYTQTEVQT